MEKRLMLVTLAIVEKMYRKHKAIISISLLCPHTHKKKRKQGKFGLNLRRWIIRLSIIVALFVSTWMKD